MKSLLGGLTLCLAVAGTASAQTDAFHGTWKMDPSKSTTAVTPLPQQEILTLEVANNGETATNDITGQDGKRRKSGYTATYNDGKWYPSKNFDTGKETGSSVMVVRLDPTNEIRIGKRADGKFGGIILRIVSAEGKTMRIITYRSDGTIDQNLHMDKQ